MKNKIVKNALANSLLTALYIVVIASFLFNAPKIFPPGPDKTVLVPIVMLCLLVFSAALTGTLIFGRPILWYLDGKKKEAMSLLAYTLGIFFVLTILALVLLFIINK